MGKFSLWPLQNMLENDILRGSGLSRIFYSTRTPMKLLKLCSQQANRNIEADIIKIVNITSHYSWYQPTVIALKSIPIKNIYKFYSIF